PEALGAADGQRSLLGDLPRDRAAVLEKLLPRQHGVDEAQLEGPLRIHPVAGEDHLFGAELADEAHQALGAAEARTDAEGHFRQTEPRVLAGEDHVAGHRQLEASTQRVAVHRRDGGGRDVLDQRGQHMAQLAEFARLPGPHRSHLGDVRAGDEGALAGAGEDDDAGVGALADRLGQLAQRLGVQRVQRLRPVDGDGRDGRLVLDQDVLVGHGQYLWKPRFVLRPSQPASTYCRKRGAGRYLSSPSPRWRTSAMERQVSSPMKSATASGPMGTLVPSFIAVSTSSAEARPSCRAKHASLSIGMRMRLTMNP